MQNFMKTIISAVQVWTKGKIKDSTADWNENDSSKDSYVRNRTHWEEEKEIVVVSEQTVEGFAVMQDPIYVAGNAFSMDIPVVGETYTVNWDGADYRVVAQDGDGLIYLGNENYVVSMTSGGDIPFAIMFADVIFVATESDATSHTISISTTQTVVHKLDSKFINLPESSNIGKEGTGAGAEIFNDYEENIASGIASHAEGDSTTASGDFSHAEGYNTIASGRVSHAEGCSNEASGENSHAEGYHNVASGESSHAEGGCETTEAGVGYNKASGKASHSEGAMTIASGKYSHAEGLNTNAKGGSSHSEGRGTIASGYSSHAEGYKTKASGSSSHAEGDSTTASGDFSHAEGYYTITSSRSQHVQGKFNIHDTEGSTNTQGKYAHIVGNGTSINTRSNAHTLDWDGNAWYQGDVYVGGTSQDDADRLLKESEIATDEDIIKFVSEMGIADPVTTSDGSVYTNANGDIYVL